MSFLLNSPYITCILGAFLIITVILLIFSVYLILYVIREYKKLEQMIDSAIDGNFQEESFDEQRLSRLQNKMYQFISSSFLGRKKVEEDKGKIEELISNISHQTKTPITTIKLYSGLLAECDLEEKEKHLVNQIVDQNDRMAFLIENLVKMSRLENGIVAVHPQMQDIALLMESLEGSYGSRTGKKIIFDPGYKKAGSVEAFYDLKWTVEAISNIIENALKYTDENGVIQISVKPYSSFTAVLVQDNGIGIAEEEQAAVFQRFYRSERVNGMKGIGLGCTWQGRSLPGREAISASNQNPEKALYFRYSWRKNSDPVKRDEEQALLIRAGTALCVPETEFRNAWGFFRFC